MRTQGNSAEANQDDDNDRGSKQENPVTTAFDQRKNKKGDLSVKEGGSNSVSAGETVARPIHEPAVYERTMAMH